MAKDPLCFWLRRTSVCVCGFDKLLGSLASRSFISSGKWNLGDLRDKTTELVGKFDKGKTKECGFST